MKLYPFSGNEQSGEWEPLNVLCLAPSDEENEDGNLLLEEMIELPGGESVVISCVYMPRNQALNLVLQQNGELLLNLSCFKRDAKAFDPSVVCRTLGGVHLSFMLGNDA